MGQEWPVEEDEGEEVKEGQAVASEKMRVLPGNEKEIRKKRAVFRPATKHETIMMRGTNASAPDLGAARVVPFSLWASPAITSAWRLPATVVTR